MIINKFCDFGNKMNSKDNKFLIISRFCEINMCFNKKCSPNLVSIDD